VAEATPQKVLDCSGLKFLEMISSDPGTQLDIAGWAKQTQNELLSVRQGEFGEWHFLIKKSR
jgi:TusA-related sulfurtransferase